MAKEYSTTPSKLLFPNIHSPILSWIIDNHIFEIGYKHEQEVQAEIEKSKIKYYTELVSAIIKAK